MWSVYVVSKLAELPSTVGNKLEASKPHEPREAWSELRSPRPGKYQVRVQDATANKFYIPGSH